MFVVVGWVVLVILAILMAGFLAMNFTDEDPAWTRDKRAGAGVVLAGLLLLFVFLTVKTYPF